MKNQERLFIISLGFAIGVLVAAVLMALLSGCAVRGRPNVDPRIYQTEVSEQ